MRGAWRPMREADLDEVMAIAAVVHAGFFERREVFAERLSLYPQGCWIAQEPAPAAMVLGYAFLHPARLGQPPALDSLLHAIDVQSDCLYLHDVALLPAARGAGLGQSLLRHLLDLMRHEHFAHAALVAVHGSAPYWGRYGFEALPDVPPALREKLRSYDERALYMMRPA